MTDRMMRYIIRKMGTNNCCSLTSKEFPGVDFFVQFNPADGYSLYMNSDCVVGDTDILTVTLALLSIHDYQVQRKRLGR